MIHPDDPQNSRWRIDDEERRREVQLIYVVQKESRLLLIGAHLQRCRFHIILFNLCLILNYVAGIISTFTRCLIIFPWILSYTYKKLNNHFKCVFAWFIPHRSLSAYFVRRISTSAEWHSVWRLPVDCSINLTFLFPFCLRLHSAEINWNVNLSFVHLL